MTEKRDLTGAPDITEAALRERLEAGHQQMDVNPGLAMANFARVIKPLLNGERSLDALLGRICTCFPSTEEQLRVTQLVFDAAACAGFLLWASPSITNELGFNAATLLEFAAANGNHPDACYHLSDLCSGRYEGYPRHAARSLAFLEKAASLGHERAMLDLGLMALQGETPDVVRARMWLNQCAALEGVFQPIALEYAEPLNQAQALYDQLQDGQTPLQQRCEAGWELCLLMQAHPGCCAASLSRVLALTQPLVKDHMTRAEEQAAFKLSQERLAALQQLQAQPFLPH
jgi:hypothetical protein